MQIIETYLTELSFGEASPNTVRTYRKDLEKLVTFFDLETIGDFENLSVEDFHRFYQSQEHLNPVSFNGLVRSLSAFVTYLKDTGKVENSAFDQVRFGRRKFKKVKKVKKDILTKEEEDAIIKAGRNIQEKFMLALALRTALRNSEIANIKMSDIKGCEITITGKGGDEFTTYLNETLCTMLSIYCAEERQTDSPYLFYSTRGKKSEDGKISGVSVNSRVKECAKLAGIDKKITAHRLRATKLTRVGLKHGLLAAQTVGNHKNKETTMIYVQTGDEYRRELLMEED